MGVIAHQAGELEERFGRDHLDRLGEGGEVRQTAAMQADIDLQVDPQLRAIGPGDLVILLQPPAAVRQPLRARGRGGMVRVALNEIGDLRRRQGPAQEHVGLWLEL